LREGWATSVVAVDEEMEEVEPVVIESEDDGEENGRPINSRVVHRRLLHQELRSDEDEKTKFRLPVDGLCAPPGASVTVTTGPAGLSSFSPPWTS